MHRKWRKYSIVMAFCFLKYAAMGQEPGTLGISVLQLYSDTQQNRHGVLIVRAVEPGSAGAEAGLVAGDIIVSVNGTASGMSPHTNLLRSQPELSRTCYLTKGLVS
jgi:predicted metalloprotease with PDZ domain